MRNSSRTGDVLLQVYFHARSRRTRLIRRRARGSPCCPQAPTSSVTRTSPDMWENWEKRKAVEKGRTRARWHRESLSVIGRAHKVVSRPARTGRHRPASEPIDEERSAAKYAGRTPANGIDADAARHALRDLEDPRHRTGGGGGPPALGVPQRWRSPLRLGLTLKEDSLKGTFMASIEFIQHARSSTPAATRPSRSRSSWSPALRSRRPVGCLPRAPSRPLSFATATRAATAAVALTAVKNATEAIGVRSRPGRLSSAVDMRCWNSTAPTTRASSAPTPSRRLHIAHAAAEEAGLPLYKYVGGPNAHILLVP